MNIATILFTYNRPEHTIKVLEGLKKNTILPEKLFIFHDGKNENTDETAWNWVEEIINGVDWCNCEVITAYKNKGLADSIIDGINYVFNSYDAAIVLEDDCVPMKPFMKYMRDALYKYQNEENVYVINAMDEPVNVTQNGCDCYFMGRINSWGWATWKNRWCVYSRDYCLLGKIKNNPELVEWYNVWGQDLEAMILGNIYGQMNSWAVFWALHVIAKKGLCLSPYRSLIDNIGFDGTGVHCGNKKPCINLLREDKDEFVFPQKIQVIDNYKDIFKGYYSWKPPIIKEMYYRNILMSWRKLEDRGGRLADWLIEHKYKNVAIWGLGDIGEEIIKNLQRCCEINICSIILSNPICDYYKNIPVNSKDNIPESVDIIIVIPGYDIENIKGIVNEKYLNRLFPVDVLLSSPLEKY